MSIPSAIPVPALSRSVLLASLFLVTSLTAQQSTLPTQAAKFSKDQVIAWAQTTAVPITGSVRVQGIDETCSTAKLRRTTTGLTATTWYAGGTAYDPRHQSVWLSDGVHIQEMELATGKILCQFKASFVRAGTVVSGLAMFDGGRRLLQLETLPGGLALRPYDVTKCPPVPLAGCEMRLRTGSVAAGLACDSVEQTALLAISAPLTGGKWSTGLLATPLSKPCRPVCGITLPVAGSITSRPGSVLGLAFNSASRTLVVTDGSSTRTVQIARTGRCELGPVETSCAVGNGSELRGLAILPGWSATPRGASCVKGTCQPCRTMRADTFGGLPVLGSKDFGLELTGAEPGAQAMLLVAFGDCTTGQMLPSMCGPIYPSLQQTLALLPPIPVTGSGSCGGSARVVLPIPAIAALRNYRFCCQWAIQCGGGSIALSQGVGFGIASY